MLRLRSVMQENPNILVRSCSRIDVDGLRSHFEDFAELLKQFYLRLWLPWASASVIVMLQTVTVHYNCSQLCNSLRRKRIWLFTDIADVNCVSTCILPFREWGILINVFYVHKLKFESTFDYLRISYLLRTLLSLFSTQTSVVWFFVGDMLV